MHQLFNMRKTAVNILIWYHLTSSDLRRFYSEVHLEVFGRRPQDQDIPKPTMNISCYNKKLKRHLYANPMKLGNDILVRRKPVSLILDYHLPQVLSSTSAGTSAGTSGGSSLRWITSEVQPHEPRVRTSSFSGARQPVELRASLQGITKAKSKSSKSTLSKFRKGIQREVNKARMPLREVNKSPQPEPPSMPKFIYSKSLKNYTGKLKFN